MLSTQLYSGIQKVVLNLPHKKENFIPSNLERRGVDSSLITHYLNEFTAQQSSSKARYVLLAFCL